MNGVVFQKVVQTRKMMMKMKFAQVHQNTHAVRVVLLFTLMKVDNGVLKMVNGVVLVQLVRVVKLLLLLNVSLNQITHVVSQLVM